MKLVIGGSTGLVGSELVRQALAHPAVTTIVGLSRRETPLPAGSVDDARKLTSAVCEDFENYSDSVKKHLEGADACIWTIAVTPSKSQSMSWDDICKISRDHAVTAIRALATGPRRHDGPLRFVYMSGHFSVRRVEDADEAVLGDRRMLDMCLMRGEAETIILDYAEQSAGAVQSAVVKPGFILAPGRNPPPVPGLPGVQVQEVAAALLDQVARGFEKDTYSNGDLVRIGQRVLTPKA